MSFSEYEPVIGLEIHAQLKTKTKMFAPDSTTFDASDNENTSPISVGMPGTLPVMNKAAIDCAIKAGLALDCQIRLRSVFSRKNYFYPDLPKGYQISQYDEPICEHGKITFALNGEPRTISITRAHLEEDAGKSQHFGNYTLVDYNRSGIPLLEIVSGPDIRSAAEAAEYARQVRQVLRYLDVCDGNLEEGSMRCDCNISLRPRGQEKFGTKVELKNINSFRFVEKAIEYEIERQADCLRRGEIIVQETRLFDSDKNLTFSMRAKEDAQDYRYFPDPDLLPVTLSQKQIDEVRAALPELPGDKRKRFVEQLGLPDYDAQILTAEKALADYFEEVVKVSHAPKPSSNWMMTELLRSLNEENKSVEDSPISPKALGDMIQMIEKGSISGKIGKTVFQEMWKSGKSAEEIVKEKGLAQVSDVGALEKIVNEVLAANASQVVDYKGGRTKLFGFFVGAVMKATKGQGNPDLVNEILKKKLS